MPPTRSSFPNRDALENPPLLIVSDTKRIRIYPTFPNTVKVVYDIALSEIDEPDNLATLRFLFTQPDMLNKGRPIDSVTVGQIGLGVRCTVQQLRYCPVKNGHGIAEGRM